MDELYALWGSSEMCYGGGVIKYTLAPQQISFNRLESGTILSSPSHISIMQYFPLWIFESNLIFPLFDYGGYVTYVWPYHLHVNESSLSPFTQSPMHLSLKECSLTILANHPEASPVFHYNLLGQVWEVFPDLPSMFGTDADLSPSVCYLAV